MLSFITNIAAGIGASRSYKAQQQSYRTQAVLSRLQGKAQKNAAYADADSIETAARGQQEIAASNLRTLRENETRVIGTLRTKQGASGFTADGTGSDNEHQAQEYFEKVVADTAQSASINCINAWQTATSTRRQGELAAMASNLQAMQYDSAARQAGMASRNIMTGTLINAVVGAGFGIYGMSKGQAQAAAYNQNVERLADKLTFATQDEKDSWIAAAKMNPGTSAVIAGDSAASWAFSTSSLLNPWTAGLTRSQNWGSHMSILMGNTPGIPDNRYSLGSFTE